LIKLADEDVELNRRELERLQKIGTPAISETVIDQAKRVELASRNSLQSLRNQLLLLKSRQARLEGTRELAATELEKAELDLSRTRVSSPVAGVIVRESVEQDSFVQKGATLVTIEDTSAVEVRCNLKMEQVTWLWRQASAAGLSASPHGGYQIPPTPVTVTYDLGDRHYSWPGKLARYEGIGLDERTRTVPCRVVVENPRGTPPSVESTSESEPGEPSLVLVRGMYVTVHLHLTPNVPLVHVPEEAIRPGKSLWVVRDQRLMVLRDLNLVDLVEIAGAAESPNRSWLIALNGSALTVGDRVVISPLSYAADGLEVREQP
jgi:multidrug efflux pump subunit AcrA (membrane-fusion protein)